MNVSTVSLRDVAFVFTGVLLGPFTKQCMKKLLTQYGNKLLLIEKLYLDFIFKEQSLRLTDTTLADKALISKTQK